MSRLLFWSFIIILGIACGLQVQHDKPKDDYTKVAQATFKSGLSFEAGPNLGLRYNVDEGIYHSFIHTTTIIRNDSTIPIHLEIGLSEELAFPELCSDSIYQVILLPEALTPDTATIYNGLFGIEDILSIADQGPPVLDKTLAPGEYCVVTIGVLNHATSNCGVVPRGVFAYEDQELYVNCDRLNNPNYKSHPQLDLAIKLEFYNQRKFLPPEDHCSIIACGQISYPDSKIHE